MSGNNKKEWVAILDFGSQYTQLIARRVREAGIISFILPCQVSLSELMKEPPKAIILSGGPASVTSAKAPKCDKRIFNLGIPILGLCYGMQLMVKLLGGEVKPTQRREYGKAYLSIVQKDKLFAGLPSRLTVWMSHGDRVVKLPSRFEIIGETRNSPVAAIRDSSQKFYGLQFHPEVAHTPQGKVIIDNFLKKVANCTSKWTISSFVKQILKEIKEEVGRERVLCALSGGVDSSVLTLLLHKAVGRQLVCIFVNNGLLRKGEAEEVRRRFKNYRINLIYVDASKRFLKKLQNVIDPEEKRRIIGHEFIQVFTSEAKKLGKIKFLAQGTLYPDVIESRSPFKGPSATIKTHHNVGGLPQRLKFKLLEPFRFLFKDEVRAVGQELGFPEEVIWRQPFPGPGLAVRVIGEVTPERLNILREADEKLQAEITKSKLNQKLWQAFAVLLPIRTVGVMGDERTYENVVAIRAVTSLDGMTADWAKLPPKLLERISTRIINEVKGVNRVVYDISSKPPSTIEWE